MKILSEFCSRFNTSVNIRSKAFRITKSKSSLGLLKLFYNNGYILSFVDHSDFEYLVYPNHAAISFYLRSFSSSSNKFVYSAKDFKSSSNQGYSYVVQTSIGYFFSYTLAVNKLGGHPVYSLDYFAL